MAALAPLFSLICLYSSAERVRYAFFTEKGQKFMTSHETFDSSPRHVHCLQCHAELRPFARIEKVGPTFVGVEDSVWFGALQNDPRVSLSLALTCACATVHRVPLAH
jgi:hypothetical protein